MPYDITAKSPAGHSITVEKATAKDALLEALELLGSGKSEVVITDLIDGRSYQSKEFQLLINEINKPQPT